MPIDTSETARNTSRWAPAAAFLLPVVLLLPFLNRAYNIDEPMFVWVAQQIAEEPLDFFGSFVDRGTVQEPMYEYNQNPPGFSYYLAAFGLAGGWSEVALRIGGLLVAGWTGFGIYLVASRLTARPLLATLLTVLTPGFLVSAATVMTDVALVGAYVWGAYCGLRWVKEGRARWLVGFLVCVVAGSMMKYYAITLVPLFLVYAWMKGRRSIPGAVAMVTVPILALAAFFLVSWRLYDVNLLRIAAEVAQDTSVREGNALLFRELVTTVFVGGCFATVAFALPLVFAPRWLAISFIGVVLLFVPAVEGYSVMELLLGSTSHDDLSMRAHLALMLWAGAWLAALPIVEVWRRRDAESVLLALWIFGCLLFVDRVNHLINARTLLPIAPALAMVLVRLMPRDAAEPVLRKRVAAPLVAGLILSLWVCAGDYAIAENGRYSARRMADRAEAEGVALHYSGLWGFQYYLERLGAHAFSVESGGLGGGHKPRMEHGELLGVSSDGRELWRSPPEGFEETAIVAYPNRWGVATYHPVGAAGFYSHLSGIVPYHFGISQPEEYGLYRWTGKSYSETSEATP